jgi:hypothetical protein
MRESFHRTAWGDLCISAPARRTIGQRFRRTARELLRFLLSPRTW